MNFLFGFSNPSSNGDLMGSDKKTKEDILKLYGPGSAAPPTAMMGGGHMWSQPPVAPSVPFVSPTVPYGVPPGYSMMPTGVGMPQSHVIPPMMTTSAFGGLPTGGLVTGVRSEDHLHQIQSQMAALKMQNANVAAANTLANNLWQ